MREGLRNIEGLGGCVLFVFRGVRLYPGTAVHRRAFHLLGFRGPIWDLILRKKTAEP